MILTISRQLVPVWRSGSLTITFCISCEDFLLYIYVMSLHYVFTLFTSSLEIFWCCKTKLIILFTAHTQAQSIHSLMRVWIGFAKSLCFWHLLYRMVLIHKNIFIFCYCCPDEGHTKSVQDVGRIKVILLLHVSFVTTNSFHPYIQYKNIGIRNNTFLPANFYFCRMTSFKNWTVDIAKFLSSAFKHVSENCCYHRLAFIASLLF